MTIQELIGDLQSLAQAYPAETPVFIGTVDGQRDIAGIEVQVTENRVELHIQAA